MRQIDLNAFKSKKPKMLSTKYSKTKVFLTEILDKREVKKNHYDRTGVKKNLSVLYSNCCAYCEKKVEKSAHIDHYRPKDTKMYYWLGAEWTNFILVCSDCNLYKSNNFEIEAKNKASKLDYKNVIDLLEKFNNNWEDLTKSMEIDSQNLKDEKPLLPHPAFDNAMSFLKFAHNGKIEPYGLSQSRELEQGEYFINTLKFDVRHSLFESRNQGITDIMNTVTALGSIRNDNDLLIQIDFLLGRILKRYIEKHEFSFMYLYCFINFKTLFIDTQEEPFKSRLLNLYMKIIHKVL